MRVTIENADLLKGINVTISGLGDVEIDAEFETFEAGDRSWESGERPGT